MDRLVQGQRREAALADRADVSIRRLFSPDAAAQGAGIALLPIGLFSRDLRQGRLVRLFDIELALGSYWLTRLDAPTRNGRHARVS